VALIAAALAFTPLCGSDDPQQSRRPSVLVHCARPSVDQWYWWVDLRYLQELHEKGFEVDYTDRHQDFTWERIRQYDVLVLYTVPLERGNYYDNSPDRPPYRDEFVALVERFLQSGGGVMLMARSLNADESFLPLIRRWGARIPHERIVESNPANVMPTPRMRGTERLWFTDNVPPSPVGRGVRQVWLPFTEHYSAAETMPLLVDDAWQVVLRGPPSSRTEPIDPARSTMLPPPDRIVREAGVRSPPLFAVRDYLAGRIAFAAIWPQYSIGQGTEWLYERCVLSEGVGNRPSDFGRLIENTLRWLAEPALASAGVGGFVADPSRYVAPNLRKGVREEFVGRTRRPARQPAAVLAAARDGTEILDGLIGAETELGSGRGSVADYARTARESGLQFVVFLEEFRTLDEQRFARLKEECRKHSDDDLLLLPGYRIETNTGNRMFVYGDGAVLPPAELVLDGRLNLQYRDRETGAYTRRSPFVDWAVYRVKASGTANIGYLALDDRPEALGMEDLRFYSAVALQLFRNGEQVEDNLDEYLETAAGTLPPTPLAVHLVGSPELLKRVAGEAVGLTHVAAEGVDRLWDELGYADQFKAPRVFVSDGPVIEGWPRVVQRYTFAAERYVPEAAHMALPVVVRSEVGLAEIRIYDGDRLFRRFLVGGERSFERVLELTASVQKTLTLVAEDVDGGRAVSSAWRAWKGGDLAPTFCGDRVNHCVAHPLMAKGPGIVQVVRTPEILAGHTWDGGPSGVRPVLTLINANRPTLVSDHGTEGDRGFSNRAVLEFADEGAVRVRSVLETLYDERIPVVNPWQTFGPLAGPSRRIRSEAVFTGFNRPTVGPHPNMWPGFARRAGAALSIFENEVSFRHELQIESLVLFRQQWYAGPFPVVLVHGRRGKALRWLDLSPDPKREKGLRFAAGDWIGVYGPDPSNLAVLWNRGEDLDLLFRGAPDGLAIVFTGAVAGRLVRQGERLHYEVLSVIDPLDARDGGKHRLSRIVRYLSRPDGLKASRGRARVAAGLVELTAEDGAAALKVDRPGRRVDLPLPVRVDGLNPRWSAGVSLEEGYVLGSYGEGHKRYRDAGFDGEGRVYATLFPDLAKTTRVTIGHPVVCDREELFVQVTRRDDRGTASSWHVSVNNPTERVVTAKFRTAMQLEGITLPVEAVTIPAGGYVVLQ
jgi:hypothetical protein